MTDEEMRQGGQGGQLQRLCAIMHRLRAPRGCPWDAEQTHQSLIPHLIEETYEVIDALRREHDADLREELGDLLLQVVFHSEIAQEQGRFCLEEVAQGICEKLIRRHPHVFESGQEEEPISSDQVLNQWERIKKAEREENDQGVKALKESRLNQVGRGLPAVLRSEKLQKKAAKAGFDWEQLDGVFEKIEEELLELRAEAVRKEKGALATEKVSAEVGDVLFSVVNLARKLGVNPEEALEKTNQKFIKRFHLMEESLRQEGTLLEESSLREMNQHWERAKQHAP